VVNDQIEVEIERCGQSGNDESLLRRDCDSLWICRRTRTTSTEIGMYYMIIKRHSCRQSRRIWKT